MLARFFTPLTDYAEEPNPYNQATALAGRPLRETILDGMQGIYCYRPNLLDYYGVPVSMFTVRMFYNRTLWKNLFGDRPPPADYDEFLALCADVREIGRTTGRSLIPIAGSKDNAPPLLNRLFSSQTQRLHLSLDTFGNLRPGPADIGLGLLRGDWSIDDPGYASGLAIIRETAASFQPGYAQIGRDDASFYFLQSRALMIATGSWDSPSFRAQADFEIGVFSLPIPSPDHPRYGAGVLGRGSEAETGTGLSFGIPRATKNPGRAIDFLRFLASHPGNTTFSRVSGWLPAVAGVETPVEVKPFLPVTVGYVDGFEPGFYMPGSNTYRVLLNQMNVLVGPAGSVAAYQDRVRAPLREAVAEDLRRAVANAHLNVNRQDVVLAALARLGPGDSHASDAKLDQLLEAQNKIEASNAWSLHELARLAEAPAAP